MKVISIIIPVYNEETYIGALLEKVAALNLTALGYEKELIIVNDGSKDKSAHIIKDFLHTYQGKHSYVEHTNHGKGYSLKKGIEKASGDIYVIQDADLEYEPQDLLTMIKHLEKKGLDICYGSRTLGYAKYGTHYSTLGFMLGGLFVSLLTSILTGKIVTDEPTCYKMFRKNCRDILLTPIENDFAWEPAVTMLLLKKKYSFAEIPIHYHPRKQTQGKKIKLKDGWYAIRTLFTYRFSKD